MVKAVLAADVFTDSKVSARVAVGVSRDSVGGCSECGRGFSRGG